MAGNFSKGGCFTEDTLVIVPSEEVPRDNARAATATIAATAIGSVRLGGRVLGENPRPWEYDSQFPEPAAGQWVCINARVKRPNAVAVEIELLRPRAWVEANGIKAGGRFEIKYPELGVIGEARIISLSACPPIAAGDGNVVIGRFVSREINNLVRLRLSDGTTIEATDIHPIWSTDRRDWVAAGKLEPGEQVESFGEFIYVESVERIGYCPAVYNIEVHGHHVYRVASVGVVVHNADPLSCAASVPGASNAGGLPWASWNNLPKVTIAGKEYASIGGRLYTEHAIERMIPSALSGYGRSVAPAFVEEAIKSGATTTRVVDGVLRTIHTLGDLVVVTEDGGKIVVTVITH